MQSYGKSFKNPLRIVLELARHKLVKLEPKTCTQADGGMEEKLNVIEIINAI